MDEAKGMVITITGVAAVLFKVAVLGLPVFPETTVDAGARCLPRSEYTDR